MRQWGNLKRRGKMNDLTTELSLSDSLGICPDIFEALELKAEIEPNTAEYISPLTNKEFTAVESVSVAITGKKPAWMTQSDWMLFQGLMSRLIADSINTGADSRGVSYLDRLEDEIRRAA
jgi:hypothetical protein